MGGLSEIAASMLSVSEQRLEFVSHNVANTGTAGYKSQDVFQDILTAASPEVSNIFQASGLGSASDLLQGQPSSQVGMQRLASLSQGKLNDTGNLLDLAISGEGFFALRNGDELIYTRDGQFSLDNDGFIVGKLNYRLQTDQGDDLQISSAQPTIMADGTVLDEGLPVGRVGVFGADQRADLISMSGTDFRAREGELEPVASTTIRQGMLEGSNVELSKEMTDMMSALREAEMGAQVIRTYDTLMGQAISTFGQGTR